MKEERCIRAHTTTTRPTSGQICAISAHVLEDTCTGRLKERRQLYSAPTRSRHQRSRNILQNYTPQSPITRKPHHQPTPKELRIPNPEQYVTMREACPQTGAIRHGRLPGHCGHCKPPQAWLIQRLCTRSVIQSKQPWLQRHNPRGWRRRGGGLGVAEEPTPDGMSVMLLHDKNPIMINPVVTRTPAPSKHSKPTSLRQQLVRRLQKANALPRFRNRARRGATACVWTAMTRHSVKDSQCTALFRKARLEMLPEPAATLASLWNTFMAPEPACPYVSSDRGTKWQMPVCLCVATLPVSPALFLAGVQCMYAPCIWGLRAAPGGDRPHRARATLLGARCPCSNRARCCRGMQAQCTLPCSSVTAWACAAANRIQIHRLPGGRYPSFLFVCVWGCLWCLLVCCCLCVCCGCWYTGL